MRFQGIHYEDMLSDVMKWWSAEEGYRAAGSRGAIAAMTGWTSSDWLIVVRDPNPTKIEAMTQALEANVWAHPGADIVQLIRLTFPRGKV